MWRGFRTGKRESKWLSGLQALNKLRDFIHKVFGMPGQSSRKRLSPTTIPGFVSTMDIGGSG
jgi:hypothetical protein